MENEEKVEKMVPVDKAGGKSMDDEIKGDKQKEMRHQLTEGYKRDADRLKQIPKELKMIDEMIDEQKTSMNLDIDKNELMQKDLKFRHENFEVVDIKFKWEQDKNWLENQKALLLKEIDGLAFKVKMTRKNNMKNVNDMMVQKAKIGRASCRERV